MFSGGCALGFLIQPPANVATKKDKKPTEKSCSTLGVTPAWQAFKNNTGDLLQVACIVFKSVIFISSCPAAG